MEKIFIFDAVNYLFRSYYAIGPMTNDKGESTSALFGFIRSIQKLLKTFSPKYVIAVFDGPDNKKSRQAVYAEYKMHRKKAPDDLYPQFDLAYQFCQMAGIPAISIPGVEADDTMATIALWAQKKGLETYLCTSDKDLFQLVCENIFVLQAHKNNLVIDRAKVKEIFDIWPEQMLDFLAITGDASDNIPGLSGFGPKTAASLLQEFKTLENILEHPEKVPGAKKQETLVKEKKIALMSKQLATLDTAVEVPHQKDFYEHKQPDIPKLAEFYRRMNFSKLLQELPSEQTNHVENREKNKTSEKKINKTEKKENSQDILNLDTDIAEKKSLNEKVSYHLIKNKEQLEKLISKLQAEKTKTICLDTETTSLRPLEAKIVGIGLGYKPQEAFYIPFNGNISSEVIVKELKKLFSNPQLHFYGHNLKYDLQVLLNYGLEIKNIAFDTMLASYLLNPHHRRHNLDRLSLEYLHKTKISFKSLVEQEDKTNPPDKTNKPDKKTVSTKTTKTLLEAPIEKVSEYCCEDVDCTIRLKQIFEKQLAEKNLTKLFTEIELPLLLVLTQMERKGIFLEEKKLAKLKEQLILKIAALEKEIHLEIGEEINLNSPKQLSEVLFGKLKLPPPRKKKTAFSTGAAVLEKLALKFPIARKLLDFRIKQKLLTTYVEALPEEINPKTHRIHPTFNQSITATGRLSCQNPNLQNIPIKSEEGLEIRKAFSPEKEGWSFLSADYSQIELRLLAHFSEDPELIQAFKNDQDIHSYTASIIFKVPLTEVSDQMRQAAKAVNFGTIYGQGPYGLTQQIAFSYKEAEEFINNYFAKYKKVKTYLENCKKQASETLETSTLFGRLRPIAEINSQHPQMRAAAERLAVNTPLQGTAADLIKIAMIEIAKVIKIKHLKGFMILQIHDELIFEVPDNELETFKKLVKEKMEQVVKLKVPLTVHMGVGKNWSEC